MFRLFKNREDIKERTQQEKQELLKEEIMELNKKTLDTIQISEYKNMITLPYQRRSVTTILVQCPTCTNIVKTINLEYELFTREELLNELNTECTKCDEVKDILKKEYNEILEQEQKIIENIKPGDRVKVLIGNAIEYGTVISYSDTSKEFNTKIITAINHYMPYERDFKIDLLYKDLYSAKILLDKGLREFNLSNIKELEKYDNRFTQQEIEYITSILERHSIDNYANANLLLMNKAIIKKLGE